MFFLLHADAGLGIFGDSFFEEVGLPCEGDESHPVKGVGVIPFFVIAESDKESICTERDIL